MDLTKLAEFFKPDEIEFRVGATNSDKSKGIALAYITNRAIQNRLDDVCGAENWRNEYKPWKEKAQLCGISINIGDEWVTKWDGADDTTTEAVKGGLSGAMKRAAVQWGIGRYLYDIPNVWVDIVPSGRSHKFKNPPTLPTKFLPQGVKNEGYLADIATDEDNTLNEILTDPDAPLTESQSNLLTEIIIANHIKTEKITKHFKIAKLEDMTYSQFDTYIKLLQSEMIGFKMPKAKSVLNIGKEKVELDEINAVLGAKK